MNKKISTIKKPKEEWEEEFNKKFMYDRGNYLEFDLMKSGNVGELINFIRYQIQKAKTQGTREAEMRGYDLGVEHFRQRAVGIIKTMQPDFVIQL